METNIKKPKVVFTFVEAGFGHMMPAKAVADAFEKKYGDACDIVRWNIFSDSESEIVKSYASELFGWTKKVANNKFLFLGEIMSYMIGSKLTLKFLDKRYNRAKDIIMNDIKKMAPDLIFNTYYSPAHFALECKRMGYIDPIVATYTPDPIVYPAWDRRSDLYFVNNEQAKRLAIKTGFNEDNVIQVPFVLRGNIANVPTNKDINRRNLGIEENKFTVLLASGAYGTKKDKKVVDAILDANLNINFAVICGKNQELFDYCNQRKQQLKNSKTTFYPIGFTDRMFEYNSASNLFIGKSGANALVESYYFGVPTLVTSYANPLEKSIAKFYISKKKCGEIIFSSKKLVKRIKEFIQNEKIQHKYQQNMKEFNNHLGAEKIADKLYESIVKKLKEKQK